MEFNFPKVEISYPSITDIFPSPPDDFYRDFESIVVENGFQFEQQSVVTKDGYILQLFRIPGKIN